MTGELLTGSSLAEGVQNVGGTSDPKAAHWPRAPALQLGYTIKVFADALHKFREM
jgi:hypothetical protein